jgi:hypothetical protein
VFFRCPGCGASGHLRIDPKFKTEAEWLAAKRPKTDESGLVLLLCFLCFKPTDTQLDVLLLIEKQRHLGDYVPRYKGRRGRGAFPVTIAARAARQLQDKGLVQPDSSAPSGYVLTPEGAERCKAEHAAHHPDQPKA